MKTVIFYKEKTDTETIIELINKIKEVRGRGFEILSVNNSKLSVAKNKSVIDIIKFDNNINLYD